MAARQYALAVNTFEAALVVMVGDSTATQALLQAKEALAQDQSEKTKLAKYKDHMEAGRLAMTAQRYEDAIKEYRGALLVMPGDPAATKARQDAEDQLKGSADTRYVQQQLERAQAALDARRFKEAVRALEPLVKEVPDNEDASRMLRDAKKTLAQAQADCDRFVKLATLALQARRYEEALLNFREAVKALPEEKDASNGLAQVEKLITDSQASQLAYERFMRLGRIAMQNKQYADALASFQEALRIAPNDILAHNGYRDALKAVKGSADRQKDFDRQVTIINAALKNRQWATAIQACNIAMKLNPDDTQVPAALQSALYGKDMEDGQAALRAKRYADAIRLFQDALVQKPGDAAATSFLGLAKGMSK
jgi:tetratricopeptide (TPR) repeat protein